MPEKFDLEKDYVLEDERVLLRTLQQNDEANLLYFSLNEPELWKFSLQTPAGEKGLKEYMSIALKFRQQGKEYPFIVYDKRSNKYAGSTRFYDIQLALGTLQLGYTWYGKDFQRTGLNRHCKYLLLSFAFETIGMERVEFRADNNNIKSITAMKAIGCKEEGILRANMPKREGGRRDSIVLSILKNEWFDEVKEKLKAQL